MIELKKKGKYSIADDVTGHRVLFVNYYMIGVPGPNNPWYLVDAALPGSAKRIKEDAASVFGENNPPQGIILTHGHFDHVGALPELLDTWPDVNVYAHFFEIPYLTGRSSYPPPDPLSGGGAMAYMSWVFPIKPINISDRLHILPDNGTIPGLPEWRYVHTPGHTPGHISLFRDKDRVLIAGDAFTTTNQNSLSSVLFQKKEFHGPPAYFTTNWQDSIDSVRLLSDLNPESAGTGHGLPSSGEDLYKGLKELLSVFEEKEIPLHSRYKDHPVIADEEGVKDMPPPVSYRAARVAALTTGILSVAGLTYWIIRSRRSRKAGV